MDGSKRWRIDSPTGQALLGVLCWVILSAASSGRAATRSSDAQSLGDFHRTFHSPVGAPAADAPLALGIVTVAGDPASEAAVRGATLAVEQANARGGLDGERFVLEVGETRGPWTTAAETGRDLRYQRDCVGILTPTSGEIAHLLAQVAIRGRVPVLSLSAESSLTRIPDPWLFRVVPDLRSVIRDLTRHAALKPGDPAIPVFVPAKRSGRAARSDLTAVAGELGLSFRPTLLIDELPTPSKARADLHGSDFVLLLAPDPESRPALDLLRRIDWRGTVLAAYPVDGGGNGESKDLRVVTARAFDPHDSSEDVRRFTGEFRARYDRAPGQNAAYAYDAARVLIAAIRAVGPDRSSVRHWMANSQTLDTVTGFQRFDGSGNRSGGTNVVPALSPAYADTQSGEHLE